MPAAVPAIPPNPRKAATNATIKNVTAQFNIYPPIKTLSADNSSYTPAPYMISLSVDAVPPRCHAPNHATALRDQAQMEMTPNPAF